MEHEPETREAAYRAWEGCGRSMRRTARRLEEQGCPIDRKTLTKWRDLYGWEQRVLGKGAEKRERGAETDDSARLIADLEAQKARYDRFFEGLGDNGIDVQATYAYTTLVRTIAEVRKKAAQKPDLYAMAPVVMDEFVKFIKADRQTGVQEAVFDLIDRFFEEIKPE